MAPAFANPTAIASLVDLLQQGIVCGSDVEELFVLLENTFHLEAVVMGVELRRLLRIRQRGVAGDYFWRSIVDPARAFLACMPLGSWYVRTQERRGNDEGLPEAALVQIETTRGQRLTLALFRASCKFDASEILLLRLLYPHLERALRTRLSRRAFSAGPDERLEDVVARAEASATITLSDGRLEWSSATGTSLEQRLQTTRARAKAMLQRAAVRGEEQWLPGNLSVTFVRPRSSQDVMIALCNNGTWSASPSQKALNVAEELLSPRQRQIARLIAAGASLAEVAAKLRIQHETARAHLSAAYDRLGVRDRARLALLLAGAEL